MSASGGADRVTVVKLPDSVIKEIATALRIKDVSRIPSSVAVSSISAEAARQFRLPERGTIPHLAIIA